MSDTVYNKVTLNGTTLIDLSEDTVTSAEDIRYDKVGHLADGTQVTGTGGMVIPSTLKDVVFVDYDGEIVAEYSASDFLALTALPDNPTHSGLTAQGWNWTLSDAQTYVESYGTLCIGQNYTTDDGKSRFYVTVTELTLPYQMALIFYASVKGGVTVNWGDGTTATSTANANAQSTLTHTYESVGDYLITLEVTDGTVNLGYGGSNMGLFFQNNAATKYSIANVRKIEIGDNVAQINRNSLRFLTNLRTISIPTTITSIGSSNVGEVFSEDINLKCVVIPSGITSLYTYNFNHCSQLKFLPMPKSLVTFTNSSITNTTNTKSLRMLTTSEMTSITNMVAYAMNSLERFSVPGTYTTLYAGYCRENAKLEKVTIPSTVTQINDYAFTASGIKEYHFLSTTPPTLANKRGMQCNANTVVYVPYSSDHSILTAYQTATNWSNFASYMQEEPQ